MVLVARRMYAFHASLPDSRPPPVSFSPPNAPPISAPLVPMLILAIPQSLPAARAEQFGFSHVLGHHGGRQSLRHAVVPIDGLF